MVACNFVEFELVFRSLVEEFFSFVKCSEEVKCRLKQILEYNVPHLSKIRGYILPLAFEQLNELSEDNLISAYRLGWIHQMQQAWLTMLDDIIDHDEHRFGKKTWTSFVNHHPICILDAELVGSGISKLLRKYFHGHANYYEICEYFENMRWEFFLGQEICESLSQDVNKVTYENYCGMIKVMSSKYMMGGSIQLALLLSGKSSKDKIWTDCDSILEKLARFYYIKDDFDDAFGKNKINPIEYKDICKGRPSYLLIKARELCKDSTLWNELVQNYGKSGEDNVFTVLRIFNQLSVQTECEKDVHAMQQDLWNEAEELKIKGNELHETFTYLIKVYSNVSD